MRSLADAIGASGLSMYAIVALVLFVFAFLLIAIPLLAPNQSDRYDALARIPLEDPTTVASPRRATHDQQHS